MHLHKVTKVYKLHKSPRELCISFYLHVMGRLQRRMSYKIVQQDIEMLVGQHNNLLLGAKAWNQAISADKMAKAYRNWLESELEKAQIWFAGF